MMYLLCLDVPKGKDWSTGVLELAMISSRVSGPSSAHFCFTFSLASPLIIWVIVDSPSSICWFWYLLGFGLALAFLAG